MLLITGTPDWHTAHPGAVIRLLELRGRNLPDVLPLVDANYTAEVETLVLTAGHDVEKLAAPVVMEISRAGDVLAQMGGLAQMNGTQRAIQPGDMVMRDREGICCTILYGQDNRSPITAETRQVLYVAYCPAGVPREAVEAQLSQIEEYVRLFAPQARLEQSRLLAR